MAPSRCSVLPEGTVAGGRSARQGGVDGVCGVGLFGSLLSGALRQSVGSVLRAALVERGGHQL